MAGMSEEEQKEYTELLGEEAYDCRRCNRYAYNRLDLITFYTGSKRSVTHGLSRGCRY